MNRILQKLFWYESRWVLLGCSFGVLAFCWFRVWIVGNFDTSEFRQIMDLLPKDWRKFASVDFDWLVSYLGRTSLTLDEPMLLLFVLAWPLIRGSDVVSGHISRGTMEMMLAQPISRSRWYWNHVCYTIGGGLILTLTCWVGMTMGIFTTSVEESTYPEIKIPLVDYAIPLTFLEPTTETVAMVSEVNPIQFLPGVVNLFFLAFVMAGFSYCVSAFDRYRWRTLGVIFIFYVISGLLKLLGMASERFVWATQFTVMGYYEPASSIELSQRVDGAGFWFSKVDEAGEMTGLGPIGNYLVLFSLGLLLFLIGWRRFVDRDVSAPL